MSAPTETKVKLFLYLNIEATDEVGGKIMVTSNALEDSDCYVLIGTEVLPFKMPSDEALNTLAMEKLQSMREAAIMELSATYMKLTAQLTSRRTACRKPA